MNAGARPTLGARLARLAGLAVCLVWTGLEIWAGNTVWAVIAGAVTAYAVWSLVLVAPRGR